MHKIFTIAGMGADTRLYQNIKFPEGFEVIPADWLIPEQADTLTTYAAKLIQHYQIKPGDIVIGNSLGGMIAVEIAKQIKLDKVILISSIKTIAEAPAYFKIFRTVPIYKAVPGKLMTSMGSLIKLVFGKMAPADLALFKSMLGKSSPVFLKWSMRAALYFDNQDEIPHLYHIIGDKDLVFPYQKIKNPTAIIKGGTHIMMFNRAAEISRILTEILRKP